jgi:pentatricopeptide repeat protein
LFGDAGDQEGMLFVCNEMKRLNITPNVVVYNTLINGFGRAGRVNIAKELFEEMCKLGVNPDVRTLTAIMKIYGKHKRVNDAMDVWNRMKENRFVKVVFFLFESNNIMSPRIAWYMSVVLPQGCTSFSWSMEDLIEDQRGPRPPKIFEN